MGVAPRARIRRLMLHSIVAVSIAVPVVLTGSVGTASAAVASHELVTAVTVLDSVTPKSVDRPCPAGKSLVGAGVGLTQGAQIVLGAMRPNATLTGLTIVGQEDETGYSGNWQLGAWALCATPPPGLQLVTSTGPSDSAITKSRVATCPAGKKLLGAGAEIIGGSGQVIIEGIVPAAALTSVTVTGREDSNGFAGVWSVRTYAICATAPAGLQLVSAISASNSTDKSQTVPCPAGKGVLGTAGKITGGVGRVGLGMLPSPADSTSAKGWEDETAITTNWSVTAYAICANVSTRQVATSSTDSSASKMAGPISCPGGRQVTGGGADITGGLGQAMLTAVLPIGNPAFNALADEDANMFIGNWSVRAYAICATPLPGLQVSSSSTANDSTGSKERTAVCTAGRKLVGAGGFIDGGNGRVVLEQIAPNPTLTGVTVIAREDETHFAGNWSVGAYAICATPPAGLQLVSVSSEPDSDPASATAACPAGKNLLGGGGAINGGSGVVVMDDMRPNALLTSMTVTALEDENGFAGDWSVTAHAICANT